MRGAGLETLEDGGSHTHHKNAYLIKTETGHSLVLPDKRELDMDDMMTVNRHGRDYRATTVRLKHDHMAFTMHGETAGLTYSEYGDWEVTDKWGDNKSIGAWATGIPTEVMPTIGTASYEGDATGKAKTLEWSYEGEAVYDVTGRARLTADFADSTITGRIGNLMVMSDCGCLESLNDVQLKGNILGNAFQGDARVMGGHPYYSGDPGRFGGRFHGPDAAEAAGTFNIENGGYGIVGSFGLQRVSP